MKQVKTITEAEYKAKVLVNNRIQAKSAPGISINPYNYASRQGLGHLRPKKKQILDQMINTDTGKVNAITIRKKNTFKGKLRRKTKTINHY